MFHQQDGDTFGINGFNDFKNFFYQDGRKPQGGFIQEKHFRTAHQGASDGQHLLLAPRKGAGPLVDAVLENGKIAEHPIEIIIDALFVMAGIGTHLKVFFYGELFENFPPFGDQGDPHAHNPIGVLTIDALSHKLDGALVRLVIDEAHDGFQNG